MGVNCLLCSQIMEKLQHSKVKADPKKQIFPYVTNKKYVNMMIEKAQKNQKIKERELLKSKL